MKQLLVRRYAWWVPIVSAVMGLVFGIFLSIVALSTPSDTPSPREAAPQVPSQYPRPTSKMCSDEGRGAFWETTQQGKILHISGESIEVYDLFRSQTSVEFIDPKGVDWAVFENCHAAVLFYGSETGSIKKILFSSIPRRFDVKDLSHVPWMGAKGIKAAITANGLSLQISQN